MSRLKMSVRLSGGPPWGFRLEGKTDEHPYLKVSKIRAKSKAFNILKVGDFVICINGIPSNNLSYDQAMDMLDSTNFDLTLDLLRIKQTPDVCDSAPLSESGSSSNKVSAPQTMCESDYDSSKKKCVEVAENCEKNQIYARENEDVKSSINPSVDDKMTKEASEDELSSSYEEEESSEDEEMCEEEQQNAVVKVKENEISEVRPPEQPHCEGKKVEECESVINKESGPTTLFCVATTAAAENISSASDGAESCSHLASGPSPKVSDGTVEGEGGGREEKHVENKFQCQIQTEELKTSRLAVLGKREEELGSRQGGNLDDDAAAAAANGHTLMYGGLTHDANTMNEQIPMFKVSKAVGRCQTWSPSVGYTRPSQITSSYQNDVWKRIKLDNSRGPRPKSMPVAPVEFDDGNEQQFRNGRAHSEEKENVNGHSIPPDSNRLMKIFQPPEEMEDLDILISKKKMFSSSSFYEEPRHIYPTVEEQVELCKKIADSLSSSSNQLSKGASMYNKRRKRADKWAFEGPDPCENDSGMDYSSSPDISNYHQNNYRSNTEIHRKLKLVLDPRQLQDATRLRHLGLYNEHNLISPDICFDLVKDLNSPTGKGGALFAKRKKKSEKWIVDENTVKQHEQQHPHFETEVSNKNVQSNFSQMPVSHLEAYEKMMNLRRLKMVKSPWEAALESPIGSCDAAFQEVIYQQKLTPKYNGQLQVSPKTEESRTVSSSPFVPLELPSVSLSPVSNDTSYLGNTSFSPNLGRFSASSADVYKPRLPKGWGGHASEFSSVNLAQEAPAYLDVASTFDGKPFSPTVNFDMKQCKDFNNTARSWNSNTLNRAQSFKTVRPPSLIFQ